MLQYKLSIRPPNPMKTRITKPLRSSALLGAASSIAISLLAAGILAGSASAATFTLQDTFNNQMNGGDPGVVVGNGFFSYDAASPLADGSYSLSSFASPSLSVTFNNGATFGLGDLESDPVNPGIGIDVVGNQFNFTVLTPNSITHGSADFLNAANNHLSLSPNQPGQSYGILNVHAAYFLDLVNTGDGGGSHDLYGAYGIGSPAATIDPPILAPEPTTYALLGLSAIGLLIRRRTAKVA